MFRMRAVVLGLGQRKTMYKIISSSIISLGLIGGAFAVTVPAVGAEVVGVHVGDVGLGIKVGNGHYYDNHHVRQNYTYPSDWHSYKHPQSWYRSHAHWNDQQHADWYRN
jgi:hypothetical protein